VAWSGIPLLNTALLVASSVTVHFAHTALKAGKRSALTLWLMITLALGFIFVGFQAYEYYHAYTELGLTLASGIYGSTFFLLTGFHGFHVCLGAVMLTVMFFRATTKGHFTPDDHFGFEAASWYWHFVDVVWICLFLFVYIL
jgi:cytochrome c oxidase subunit 3